MYSCVYRADGLLVWRWQDVGGWQAARDRPPKRPMHHQLLGEGKRPPPFIMPPHTHDSTPKRINRDGRINVVSLAPRMPLPYLAQLVAEPLATAAAAAAAAAAGGDPAAIAAAGKAAGEVAKVASALIFNTADTCGMKRCFLEESDANKPVKFRLYPDRVQIVPGSSSNCDTGVKTLSH